MIAFKWENYGHKSHFVGFFMHCFLITTITTYIYNTYLIGTYGEATDEIYTYLMIVGIIYPFIYDSIQLYKSGWDYFKDSWNYTDLAFTWSGVINIFFKFLIKEQDDLRQVISMSVVILLALVKLMYFLRIFDSLSYLVTLIKQVIIDLKSFMLFYVIICFMLSLIIGTLGFQNFTKRPEMWEEMQENWEYPGIEYMYLGRLVGNIISVIRMSIGDNNFDASIYLDPSTNIVFWIIWILTLYVTCIIFLNFIIAEACESYQRVS